MEILGHYLFLAAGNYLSSVICIMLAVLVLHANPRSKSCRLAFAFNVFVSFWAFFYATMFVAKEAGFGTWASQMFTLAAAALGPALTHLVLVEVRKEREKKTFIRFNYLASLIFGFLIFVPGLVIKGAPPKLDLPSYIDGGPLYFLVPLQLFFNFFFSMGHLVGGIRRAKGYRKNQLLLFLLALGVGYGMGTPGYLLAFDIPVKPVLSPLLALYPVILTYTIVKHRFLNIEKLAKNTLIFSALFILLLACVSAVLYLLKEVISRWVGISEAVAQGIAIALAIGLYGPLKTGLSRFTNRLLFQHSQNPETIFTNLSEDIMRFLDTKELAREVTNRIAEILALDRIGFYTRSRTHGYLFELQSGVGRLRKKQIHQSRQLIGHLEHTKDFLVTPHTQAEARRFSQEKPPFALQNMKEVKKQAAMELAALGGVAAFPVFVRDTLRAVLITGRKKSDASWNEEEFQILKSFMRHLSLAFGNADYAEEIRRFREKLSLSERDASAGALIAAVDHEVNSTIHGMSLNLTTLSRDLSNPKTLSIPREKVEKLVLETMESVLRGGAKINSIIQHLSDLAERKPLSIEEGVKPSEMADRVIRELGIEGPPRKVRIQSKIPRTLRLACDPGGLYEILVNLILNAQQAIETEGEILIEGSAEKGEVLLEIRDTGVGIPSECRERIFEPFFTTKIGNEGEGPMGTGMGLFIVKEFMEGMGGSVEVRSEPGKGTTFRLRFPHLEPAFGRAAE